MASNPPIKSSREKDREDRGWSRVQGVRPIKILVPDVCSLEFAVEAHRQSLAAAASVHEREDQTFIDAVSDLAVSPKTAREA
ncbi:MAG: antitoxin MazE-like protein [Beijerinckiaceae bacterium]|jgi:hypothetical protein